jgi:hypothetical protein
MDIGEILGTRQVRPTEDPVPKPEDATVYVVEMLYDGSHPDYMNTHLIGPVTDEQADEVIEYAREIERRAFTLVPGSYEAWKREKEEE